MLEIQTSTISNKNHSILSQHQLIALETPDSGKSKAQSAGFSARNQALINLGSFDQQHLAKR